MSDDETVEMISLKPWVDTKGRLRFEITFEKRMAFTLSCDEPAPEPSEDPTTVM